MPTTATVAPPTERSGADIASGLRALADIVEADAQLAAAMNVVPGPRATIHLTGVAAVEAFAARFGKTPMDIAAGDSSHIIATGNLDGLDVTVYTRVRRADLPTVSEAAA
ncbi:hypothetical protein QE418_000542 [Microbacterium testaceum]|uniref:hypothetical protein n=1 Tax=Microbacterium TaxID=33882 RepID=UPI00278657F7|nr:MULTISPECIES: hypothetical protein [Microbacterium]MDQ1111094.1 hypothetical protein [Microbacterium testaceum]MDR6098364.1 hypothetical protein [Microbacterium sp. SORGH_AS_0454]